jgi:malonate transporter
MLLFRALSQKPVTEIANPAYIAVYLAGTLSMVVLGYLVVRKLFGRERMTAAISAMGMSCPNSGFVGFPIMLLTFPSIAGTVLALNMFVENVFIIPLAADARGTRQGAGGPSVAGAGKRSGRLALNPLVIGLLAGLLFSLTGLQLPGPVAKSVDLFAQSSAALSLFVIGGMLVGLPMTGLGRAHRADRHRQAACPSGAHVCLC